MRPIQTRRYHSRKDLTAFRYGIPADSETMPGQLPAGNMIWAKKGSGWVAVFVDHAGPETEARDGDYIYLLDGSNEWKSMPAGEFEAAYELT